MILVIILKKKAINKMKLRRPLFFYVFSDNDKVILINDKYPNLRAEGRTLKEAISKIDLKILTLVALYGSFMTTLQLSFTVYLLDGMTKTWGDLDVQSIRSRLK